MRRYYNTTTIGMAILMVFIAMRGFRGNIGEWIYTQLIALPGIIIGLSFHEFAHAIVAYKLGDITPKLQGRVTVNPLAHIDPFGFVTLFLAGFGWGRAVEINPYNFKNRRRDELIVSLAGVVMNLLIAVVFTAIFKLISANMTVSSFQGGEVLLTIIYYVVYINIVLMVFNLLPIPPLDGFSIATEIFDLRKNPWYWTVYNNGFMILMIFVVTGFTGRIMTPFIRTFMGLLGLY